MILCGLRVMVMVAEFIFLRKRSVLINNKKYVVIGGESVDVVNGKHANSPTETGTKTYIVLRDWVAGTTKPAKMYVQ